MICKPRKDVSEMIDKNRIFRDLERLVAIPSVSGTVHEAEGAYGIRDLICEIPYFQAHKDNVELVPIEGDALGRSLITAYLECCPESKKVVILTGHYDVVDVEEFGHLQKEAYDIEAITKRINEMPLDDDARRDFESGEWYFGRGTADMKIGHAICIELLRYYSEEKKINGNILYVGVCGEETNSEGMLRAVPFFNEFRAKHGIEYEALLLAECYMVENQTTDDIRYIHYGAEGKVMPMFFCVGAATHSEEPFMGIDPLLMSSEVYKRIQLNPELCEHANGQVGQAPVCLKSQDLKSTYSCSTPLYAASYYNLVTLNLNPQELMNKLTDIARDSFAAAIEFTARKAEEYEKKFGVMPAAYKTEPIVKTFAQAYAEAKSVSEGDFDKIIENLIKDEMKPGVEMQDIAIKIVKKVYESLPEKHPMIIVSVIPPYYPDNFGDKNEPKTAKMFECANDVIQYAKTEFDEELKIKDYYCISDLSYTMLNEGMDFDELFENVVGANQMYTLPTEDMKKFSVPAIVLGGYGKDLHKHTERLHKHYNFDVLPYLYIRFIDKLLG